MCGSSFSCLQSVIGTVELSNGSAHFGSESDLHTQHLMQSPVKSNSLSNNLIQFGNALSTECLVTTGDYECFVHHVQSWLDPRFFFFWFKPPIVFGCNLNTTVSLLYDLAGGSACRRGPCDLHCISPFVSLWRPHPTSVFTRVAAWLVF